MRFNDIQTRNDLAEHLEIPIKTLTYVLYEVHVDSFYHSFEIQKKNGGVRQIEAPQGVLKTIQSSLAQRLSEYQQSLRDGNKANISHAFEKGKGIITNAKIHRNKRYIISFDLENFFESFHFGRVAGYFQNNRDFKLPREVAIIIAQLTCFNGHLPQGAPSSPIITNLICQIMDYRLLKIARKYKLDYTRYADDLSFSTNSRNFLDQKDVFVDELMKEIESSGFRLNESKTRLEFRDSRQVVTGLIVNKKINVPREFYKDTRAMLESLYTTGEFKIGEESGNIQQLEGRLSFIDQIEKYNNIHDDSGKKHESHTLSTKEKAYRNFLFYKNFLANEKPIILVEGKTDILYLKAALKNLYLRYPRLVSKDDKGAFKYSFGFLKRSHHWQYFFGISQDGADVMAKLFCFFNGKDNRDNLLEYFNKKKTRFSQNPVIFLFDNEQKTERPLKKFISKAALTNTQKKSLEKDNCVQIEPMCNLSLVAVPLPAGKDECEMEDLFTQETLDKVIDGRTFSRKDEDPSKYYNKDIFSKYIYSNYQKINFDGFIPLLDIIDGIVARATPANTSSKP